MSRRIITAPKLWSYFQFQKRYYSLSNTIQYNTQIFNVFAYFVYFTFICLGLGFFKPIFWAIGISNVALVSFLYLKTKRQCQGITISRKAPTFAREKQLIEVHYVISNDTAFPINGLSFMEEFDGVQTGYYNVALNRPLKPHTKIQFVKKVGLDAGMGIKTFNPTNFILKDDLGMFDFKITFDHTHEIEVYPSIEETPSLKASVSPETIEYGFYEMPKRGDSNLFIGTRDYRHGDPVKHINWKLTKKSHKVVVNEYEKNTNTFVTLLMDLDYSNQLGFGELSTWEASKDLALSIVSNEIRKNNQVQVVTDNMVIPFSSGRSQLMTIERHFTQHEMVSSQTSNHLRHLHNLPAKGQIYYICPMLTTLKITETLEFLKRLKILGQEVVIFVLDPYAELQKAVKGDMRLGIMEMDRHARVEFELWEKSFKNMGVHFSYLKVERNLRLKEQLVETAMDLMEGKK